MTSTIPRGPPGVVTYRYKQEQIGSQMAYVALAGSHEVGISSRSMHRTRHHRLSCRRRRRTSPPVLSPHSLLWIRAGSFSLSPSAINPPTSERRLVSPLMPGFMSRTSLFPTASSTCTSLRPRPRLTALPAKATLHSIPLARRPKTMLHRIPARHKAGATCRRTRTAPRPSIQGHHRNSCIRISPPLDTATVLGGMTRPTTKAHLTTTGSAWRPTTIAVRSSIPTRWRTEGVRGGATAQSRFRAGVAGCSHASSRTVSGSFQSRGMTIDTGGRGVEIPVGRGPPTWTNTRVGVGAAAEGRMFHL